MKDLKNLRLIAKGGQKEVYTAEHTQYGSVVYKKIFPQEESLERTKREVLAVSILTSDRVPHIYEHNCDEPNAEFLWIMEQYVEGETLRTKLNKGETYNTNGIVSFIDTLLDICQETERLNLVHRDIKPENIIVGNDNSFWLLDFGIARHLDLESITPTEASWGLFTLGYASSEQFRNLKKEIDIRSDLFSIGVVAYEMYTGSNPYRKGTTDPLQVLRNMERVSLKPIRINGDKEFLLWGFISMISDIRRIRRPNSAREAKSIFNNVKPTLRPS